MSAIQYRPEVDGLRAVAVIPVVLFHLSAAWLPGGFVGVDVFFVISGYLITSIILKEQAAGTFTFKNFWMRRVRRILPALLTMLVVTGVASYFIMFGPAWAGIGEQILSAIFIYANIEMWQLAGNYWGSAAENAPFLHTWSLSVEEQFYLFYPLILLTLLKFVPKRTFALILLGTAFSFAIGVYATANSPSAAFYFLPTRAWELAAGCLLAIFEKSRGPAPPGGISRSLAAAGLGLIVIGYFVIQGSEGFPGFLALLPVVGSVLVIRYAGSEKCFTGNLLSSAPMIYIGKCSYSLYLWHWPVIVLAAAMNLKSPGIVGLPLIICIMAVCTYISYQYVERPTRKMVGVLKPVTVGLIASVVLTFFLMRVEYKYDLSIFEPVISYNRSYDIAPKKLAEGQTIEGIISSDWPTDFEVAYSKDGVRRDYGDGDPDIVVLGSSHGLMWARIFDEVAEELEVPIAFYTARATPPLIEFPSSVKGYQNFTPQQKEEYDSVRLDRLKRWSPSLVVILDRWSVRGAMNTYSDFIEYIHDQGSHVLFVEQPPEVYAGDSGVPLLLAYRGIHGGAISMEEHHAESVKLANASLLELASNSPSIHTLQVYDLYLADELGHVMVCQGNRILYMDGDHLTYAGSLLAKERIIEKVKSIISR